MTSSGRPSVDIAKMSAIATAIMATLGIVFSLGIAFGTLGQHTCGIEKNELRVVALERQAATVAADLREIKAILQMIRNGYDGKRMDQ